jgi:putative transposase
MLNFKFRLYPTAEQEHKLEETLDGCRWLYNHFLTLQPMSEYDMNYALTELKEQHPWLRNYHSKMLQMVGKQGSAARKALVALKKKRHRAGRLRYMRDEEYNTFTYNQSGFAIEAGRLRLSKIGSIRIMLHRLPTNIRLAARNAFQPLQYGTVLPSPIWWVAT